MSTIDLIYAMAAADAVNSTDVFNDLMAERISDLIQAKREALAKSLFNDVVEEEIEQVDELSHDTLNSYLKKNVADQEKHHDLKKVYPKGSPEHAKHARKHIRRQNGLEAAGDKLDGETAAERQHPSKKK